MAENDDTQLKPQSLTLEGINRARRAVYGVFADWCDPEWGMPLVYLNGYAISTSAFSFLERIRTLPVDQEDIFVTSYPKSGTTWMQHIVWYLVTQDFENKESIDLRFPELEIPPPYPPVPSNLDEIVNKRAPPRMFKSHYPYDFMPRDILKGRLIYVYRNPKDTIVSNFHHLRAQTPPNFPGTFEQFFNLMIEGRAWFGPWHKHIKSYYNASKQHPDHIMLISFEELKRDRLGAIKKVAKFIGRENLSEEIFQKIYEETSFEAMKKNETGNYDWLKKIGFWDKNLQPFMRKGVVGDWKNYFTPELQTRLNDYLAKNMADCDLKFVDSQ